VKSDETKKKKAHPPESPLNGGMNSTIPLLLGHPERLREGVRISL
jgi:hypothetical protein